MKNKVQENKAIFLDRDGTLIKEKNFLANIKDIEIFKSAFSALKKLQQEGFLLFIVSNQSGIGRGYFTQEKVAEIHNALKNIFAKKNIFFTDIFFCPHKPEDKCSCRKPAIKLFLQAQKKYKINFKNSYIIGDKVSDVQAGKNIKAKTILVLTGYGKRTYLELKAKKCSVDFVAKNLLSAVNWIIKQNSNLN